MDPDLNPDSEFVVLHSGGDIAHQGDDREIAFECFFRKVTEIMEENSDIDLERDLVRFHGFHSTDLPPFEGKPVILAILKEDVVAMLVGGTNEDLTEMLAARAHRRGASLH